MTLIEFAASKQTSMVGLARAWGIPSQTLRGYCCYLRGMRGKHTPARCPTPERQADIERLSKGLITPADWPARKPTEETS